MSSKDLSAVVKTQKAFIKELLDRLEGKINFDKPININFDDYIFVNIQGTDYLLSAVTNMLNDSCFKGLSFLEIIELSKKSIRLISDNCKMQHKLEDIYECLDNSTLGQHIKEVIDRKD